MDLIQYRVVMVIELVRIAAYPKDASITIARYNTMYKAHTPIWYYHHQQGAIKKEEKRA